MDMTDPILQEAEALRQALDEGRIYINAQKRSDYDPTTHTGGFYWTYADPLIRALMERVRHLEHSEKSWKSAYEGDVVIRERAFARIAALEAQLNDADEGTDAEERENAQLRVTIASLEAERDIWRREADFWHVQSGGRVPLEDRDPSEIAARVEQNLIKQCGGESPTKSVRATRPSDDAQNTSKEVAFNLSNHRT